MIVPPWATRATRLRRSQKVKFRNVHNQKYNGGLLKNGLSESHHFWLIDSPGAGDVPFGVQSQVPSEFLYFLKFSHFDYYLPLNKY